jgi:hypothetical protein
MRPHTAIFLAAMLVIPGLAPGVSRAQAVPRTDTPRGGTLRVSFEPVITTWDQEFTDSGKQQIGVALYRAFPPTFSCTRVAGLLTCNIVAANVLARAEKRVTPLFLEFGLSNRIALSARLPLVRVKVQAWRDTSTAGAILHSLLSDSIYDYAPIDVTDRRLRYFAGDIEVGAKYRLLVGRHANYATSVAFVARLPTGHQDSPHDLFDIPTGDHQTDLEVQAAQELVVGRRLWLNAAVRVGRQLEGTRERRIGPPSTPLIPRAATALLNWRPGSYAAIDVAPLYRFGFAPTFGVGFTAGYWRKQPDHYRYRSAQDSIDVATRLGAPVAAGVLDAGTAERWVRLGVAMTYVGTDVEGSLSFERTVSGSGGGGRVPAATVFRIVMRTSRWPF